MKRKIYERLLRWKNFEASKCALMIEGARRVGKSFIVEEFAKSEYESYLVIDFAKAKKSIKEIFEDKLDDLDDFFMLLSARTGLSVIPGRTLLVFDEVQRFPRAREAVKYLVKDGRCHYIETGSLISIKKNVEGIVIPSEELKIQMHPMDFEEFLWAIGRETTLPLVRRRLSDLSPMGQTDHQMMMELFRQYLVVGGMPQAVAAFAAAKRLEESEFAKKMILDLYYEDIGKFAGRLKDKVRAIWRAIPGELSLRDRRFSPGAVGDSVRMRELDAPFEWLRESMTVNLATNVVDPGIGRFTEDRLGKKCYMADTGLLVTHAFSDNPDATLGIVQKILIGKIELNKGMLMENVVAQMFRATGQELHFHLTSSQKRAEDRMEIDFLVTKSHVSSRRNVIPVEVKSSNDYSLVSLKKFMKKYSGCVAAPCILSPGDLQMNNGIVRLPLYMAPFVHDMETK